MAKILNIGDTVMWSGAWGMQEPKETYVRGIMKCFINGCKGGTNVTSVDWSELDDRNYLIDLSNGNWCWAFQIQPMPERK